MGYRETGKIVEIGDMLTAFEEEPLPSLSSPRAILKDSSRFITGSIAE